MDTESRFTKSQLWKLKASQRKTIYRRKNSLVALPTFLKLSIKFQRNRLPNDQDLKLFNVRPPPKFCFINLFMSSLSPAALTVISHFEVTWRKLPVNKFIKLLIITIPNYLPSFRKNRQMFHLQIKICQITSLVKP